MQPYKTRHIKFKETISVNDWNVKIYSISKTDDFNNEPFYKNVLQQLPEWLSMENSFNTSHNGMAFLILHEGTEGIFSLMNWWVGENMLNTNIFITDHQQLNVFKKISGNGLAPCIWELEIINHERLSWMSHVLKQYENPDYESYLTHTIDCEI